MVASAVSVVLLLGCLYVNLHLSAAAVTPHLVTIQSIANQAQDTSDEARLIGDLLSRYEKHGKNSRPLLSTGREAGRENKDSRVTDKYGLRLMHVDLDEKDQVMQTSAWIRMQWFNEYLRWNQTEYGGVRYITLPHEKIWHPDIVLVNTAEAKVEERRPLVQVNSTGSVFWTPHAQFTSACLIDITKYPFDQHTCDMWFQSIAHRTTVLELVPYTTSLHNTSLDLSTYLASYKASQYWDIIENSTEPFAHLQDVGTVLLYSRRCALRFRLVLQRRPGFGAYLLCVPCIIISFLIPLIFCLPHERPDRHTIAMSLFASNLVLLLILVTEAPPSAASTPTLCFYYGFNMVVVMMATLCSVTVIAISRRAISGRPVPLALRKIFNTFCARILGVNPPGSKMPCPSANVGKTFCVDPDIAQQWLLLTAVLDRLFLVTFIILAVIAIICFYPRS